MLNNAQTAANLQRPKEKSSKTPPDYHIFLLVNLSVMSHTRKLSFVLNDIVSPC